jgi:hypothetical protein
LALLQTVYLTPGGCPNTILRFCTIFYETFFPGSLFNGIYIALHVYQHNEILSYKNVPIELRLLLYVCSALLCFFLWLVVPSEMRLVVPEIFCKFWHEFRCVIQNSYGQALYNKSHFRFTFWTQYLGFTSCW